MKRIILNRIKVVRKELHMSVRDLAIKCELSHSAITDLENGLSVPTHISMLLICKGLDKKFEEIFVTDPSILDSYFGRNSDQHK